MCSTRFPSRGGAMRWHPYGTPSTHVSKSAPNITVKPQCSSSQQQQQSSTSRIIQLNTPVTSLVSTLDVFRAPPRPPAIGHSISANFYLNQKERRDAKRAQKEKFETALKELAVQRLSDIWKETSYIIDTLQCFTRLRESPGEISTQGASRTPGKPGLQLPSPSTPNSLHFYSPLESRFVQTTCNNPSPPRRIPLRAFVHEVLRRSKTMWPALQVALCYLDAAKSKVPIAIEEAKQGMGLQAAEAALDSLFDSPDASDTPKKESCPPTNMSLLTPETQGASPMSSDSGVSAVQDVDDSCHANVVDCGMPGNASLRKKTPPVSQPPLPPRPSPLLCPRRMFIAALILATKFTQDRVYSNRAWAKICGLDAREISRCERALGEALEWRLWVGKGVADEPTQFLRNFLLAEETLAKRKASSSGLTRCQSESAVLQSTSNSPIMPALKRSTSLPNGSLFGTPSSSVSTPMLNDAATIVLTPVNADIDAMAQQQEPTPLLEHSTCSSAPSSVFSTTPTLSLSFSNSFSSSGFSFTPVSNHGLPTPAYSQNFMPDCQFGSSDNYNFLTYVSEKPCKTAYAAEGSSFDSVVRFSPGVEGTLAMRIEDIDHHF